MNQVKININIIAQNSLERHCERPSSDRNCLPMYCIFSRPRRGMRPLFDQRLLTKITKIQTLLILESFLSSKLFFLEVHSFFNEKKRFLTSQKTCVGPALPSASFYVSCHFDGSAMASWVASCTTSCGTHPRDC
jgi:hypothetical protein